MIHQGDRTALLLILFVASLLRFWQFWELPFMHDEFSALFRTRFSNFSDLISEGVMRNDSHPAGVQVFLYYWVKLFGFNEFWIKLPFAILGVGSVWLIAAIGKHWFNVTTGLIVAAMVASMQFFIFHSQLARPYAPGLFFVLLSVYIMTKYILEGYKPRTYIFVLFGIALALAAYMHYFALLMAGMIYVSGLFLIRKKARFQYLLAGAVAILLYLPHVFVFWHQISAGGIGGWLGAPTPVFLIQFFKYTFHYSWLFGLAVVSYSLLSLSWPVWSKWENKFRHIGFLWFFGTFLTAYLYSVLRTPILQFSTLLFSFPFLLMSVFSFTRPLKGVHNLIVASIILSIGTATLVVNRKHFDLMYHQGFDQIAVEMENDRKQFGDNITFAAVGGTPEMLTFYLNRNTAANVELFKMREQHQGIWYFPSRSQSTYFGVAWTDYAPLEWIESVRSRYGKVIRHMSWFNSEYFLFEKDSNQHNKDAMPYRLKGERLLLNEAFNNGPIVFDQNTPYGILWEMEGKTTFQKQDAAVIAGVKGIAIDTLKQVKLVLEFKNTTNNESVYWMAGDLDGLTVLPGKEFRLFTAYRFDAGAENIKNLQFRSYIWNQGAEKFHISERNIYTRPIDYRLLGLFGPLK